MNSSTTLSLHETITTQKINHSTTKKKINGSTVFFLFLPVDFSHFSFCQLIVCDVTFVKWITKNKMESSLSLHEVVTQLQSVFADPAKTLACGHMLSYEVGTQLQKQKALWEEEQRRIAFTIEKEMHNSFLISPQRAQETSLRHQNIMENFLRDLDDRRRAVCRNSRRKFLQWLKAAATSDENRQEETVRTDNTKRAIKSVVVTANPLLDQSMLIPIDYGRVSVEANHQCVKIPIFGPHAQERVSLSVALSPLEDLEHFLPLIHNHQHDLPDSREAAMRAIALLGRFVATSIFSSHHSTPFVMTPVMRQLMTVSHSVLLFFGSGDVSRDFQQTCIDPVKDFRFDIVDDDADDDVSNNQENFNRRIRIPMSKTLKAIVDHHDKYLRIDPIKGFWGATLGVKFCSSSSQNTQLQQRQRIAVQEVVDHCVSQWNASMISVVLSNSLSNDEARTISDVACQSLTTTAQDSYTSLRIQSRNGVKIPMSIPTSSSALPSATTTMTSISSPIGCSVRFFVPKMKLQVVYETLLKNQRDDNKS